MQDPSPKRGPEAHPNWLPCQVAPLEAFNDELAEDGLAAIVQPDYAPRTGRKSTTVETVFASRCCGYANAPTATELYDAMRTEEPTEREREVLCAWVIEGTECDWLLAWTEQAYSWRMLARAVAMSGFPCWERIRNLNIVVKKPLLVPLEWLPSQKQERRSTARGYGTLGRRDRGRARTIVRLKRLGAHDRRFPAHTKRRPKRVKQRRGKQPGDAGATRADERYGPARKEGPGRSATGRGATGRRKSRATSAGERAGADG